LSFAQWPGDVSSCHRSGRSNGELLFQDVSVGLASCSIHWFVETARKKVNRWVEVRWDRLMDHRFEVLVDPVTSCWEVVSGGDEKTFVLTDGFNLQKPWFVDEVIV